jgi:hypothetical protein
MARVLHGPEERKADDAEEEEAGGHGDVSNAVFVAANSNVGKAIIFHRDLSLQGDEIRFRFRIDGEEVGLARR